MAADTIATLHYAVRARVLLKHLGQLLQMLAWLTLVPCGVSLWFGEIPLAGAYALLALLSAGAGWPLGRLEAPSQIQANEALVVTALIFLAASLLNALPMLVSGLTFSDAFFEAVSGMTTTGLSTVADIEHMPRGFLFARAWMQWYGGLGFAVLSIALIMGYTIAARRLMDSGAAEGLATTTRTYARQVLRGYVVLTVLGVLALWPFAGNVFDAIVHSMAAVSTGGFSNFNANLAGIPSTGFQVVATIISLAGAIALPVYIRALRHGPRVLLIDGELRWLCGLTVLWWSILTWQFLIGGLAPADAVLHGFIFAASAQSTTGFSTLPSTMLSPVALAVLIPAMIIGGGVGSTAGGVKLLRFLILVKLLKSVFVRPGLAPHAVWQAKVGDRALEAGEANQALVILMLFLGVIFLSWLLFLLYGYDPLQSLFEVVSATCTTGLSTGITTADMPTLLKYVLCVDMLLGRVEILALLLLFFPPTWMGKRGETS